MTPDLESLLDAAQDGEPEATRELVAMVRAALRRPDRRVGSVFMPKGRGGEPEWIAAQRAELYAGYRDFAAVEYGTAALTPRQAKAVARKVRRLIASAHLAEGAGDLRLDAVRRIKGTGLQPIAWRQLLRVLPEKK